MHRSYYEYMDPYNIFEGIIIPSSNNEKVQIVILCGTSEEAYQTYEVFRTNGCLSEEFDDYYSIKMKTNLNYMLNIRIYQCPIMGSVAAGIYTTHLLLKLEPEWLFMTGVCAGNPALGVKLGDLIVATSAFDLNSGKKETESLQYDVKPYSIDSRVGSKITRLNSELNTGLSSIELGIVFGVKIKSQHPARKKYDILKILYNYYIDLEDQARECERTGELSRFKQINLDIMHGTVSQKYIVNRLVLISSCSRRENTTTDELNSTSALLLELQNEGIVTNMSPNEYRLTNEQIRTIRAKTTDVGLSNLIYHPTIHVGKIATDTSAVRSDFTSDKWSTLSREISQRNIYGLEMEGYGLYMAAHIHNDLGKSKTKFLLVKAVSDLANNNKNHIYHEYGKQLSAAYIYVFINRQTFETASRIHENNTYRDISGLNLILHQELLIFEKLIKDRGVNRDLVLEKIKIFLQEELLYQRTPYMDLQQQKESIDIDVGMLFVVSISFTIEVDSENYLEREKIDKKFKNRCICISQRKTNSVKSNSTTNNNTTQYVDTLTIDTNLNLIFLNDGNILEIHNLKNADFQFKKTLNISSIINSNYRNCMPIEVTAEGISLEREDLRDTNYPPPKSIVDKIFYANQGSIKLLDGIIPTYQKLNINCQAINIIRFKWEKLGELRAIVTAESDLLYPISITDNSN
jgi:nucleoside phosphorylase